VPLPSFLWKGGAGEPGRRREGFCAPQVRPNPSRARQSRSPAPSRAPAATRDLGKPRVWMDWSSREFKTKVLSPFRAAILFLLPREGATRWDSHVKPRLSSGGWTSPRSEENARRRAAVPAWREAVPAPQRWRCPRGERAGRGDGAAGGKVAGSCPAGALGLGFVL